MRYIEQVYRLTTKDRILCATRPVEFFTLDDEKFNSSMEMEIVNQSMFIDSLLTDTGKVYFRVCFSGLNIKYWSLFYSDGTRMHSSNNNKVSGSSWQEKQAQKVLDNMGIK